MKKHKVGIIIVNWNNYQETLECLSSLVRATSQKSSMEIILIDNASTDGSVLAINQWLKENRLDVLLVQNKQNLGFAGGNNVGFQAVLNNKEFDYAMLLNSDTLVKEDFLDQLIDVVEKDENIGCAQSLLLKPDKETVDSLGQEMAGLNIRDKSQGQKWNNEINSPKEIFGPCAAAALYRTSALKKSGVFDETFFIGLEDVDLSWKIRLAGFASYLAPKSIVYHKGGVSREKKKKTSKVELYSFLNSARIFSLYYPLNLKMRFFIFYLLIRSYIASKKAGIKISFKREWKRLQAKRRDLDQFLLKDIQQKWIK